MSAPTYQLHPIGVVRAVGQRYQLHIAPPYRPALRHLDQFSHVMVLWWGHHHDNPTDRATLQANLPYAPGVRAGVFACRAEYRPNPILLTTCFLFGVDEPTGIVDLAHIDAKDGTPILDLKPYIPMSDRVREVSVPDWLAMLPDCQEDAAAFFASTDLNFG